MDKHPVVFLLLLLPLPVWPMLWFWFFRIMIRRRPASWVGVLAALPCVALAVASYVVLAQWLEEPWYARIAAVIYGSPTFFFILFGAMSWLPRDHSMADGLVGRRQLAAREKINQVNKAVVLCSENKTL
jgi:hypothetical protein